MESFSLRAGQEILNTAYLEGRVSPPAKPSATLESVRGGLGLDDSRADYSAIPGRNIGQALRLSSRPRQCLSIFVICIALAMGVKARAQSPTLSEEEKLEQDFTDPLTTLPQLIVRDSYTPANY